MTRRFKRDFPPSSTLANVSGKMDVSRIHEVNSLFFFSSRGEQERLLDNWLQWLPCHLQHCRVFAHWAPGIDLLKWVSKLTQIFFFVIQWQKNLPLFFCCLCFPLLSSFVKGTQSKSFSFHMYLWYQFQQFSECLKEVGICFFCPPTHFENSTKCLICNACRLYRKASYGI